MSSESATPQGKVAFTLITLALCLVVGFLHFWKLGVVPRGFYGDEASNAYNAYSIALTGADEYGMQYPVFFRCFDDYHDPVMIYFLAPFVKTFGLTQPVARFPSALFLMLAAAAFGLLVQIHCHNRWLALLGATMFSLSPWAFPISRAISGGYTAMLFGMNLGWAASLVALRKESHRWAVVAGVGWAFAMYAHNVGRPMTAMWLIGFALVLNVLLTKRWRIWLSFSFSFMLCLLPMIMVAWNSPETLTNRFHSVGIGQGQASLGDTLHQFAGRYIEYFSPRFLFLTGDSNLRHHSGSGGELFLFTIPLVLTGLLYSIRFFRSQPYYRLLMIALVSYPLAASLTVDRMHAGRSIDGMIPWLLVAMVGARALWLHRRLGQKLLAVICAVGLIETAVYLADYFGPYQTRSSAAYQTGFTDALSYCFGHLGDHRTFYVSGSVGSACSAYIDTDYKPFAYMYLLFHGRIDPRSYQHSGLSNTVIRPYLEQIDGPGILLRCNNTPVIEENRLAIVPNYESVPQTAKLLVTFQDETLVYQVWDVK